MKRQYWMVAILKPNGMGCAHHTNIAINVHPIKYAIDTGDVVLFALPITAQQFKSAKRDSDKHYTDVHPDQPIIACANYRIP